MIPTRTHKTCSVCGQSKPVESFHVSSKGYLQGRCKPCAKVYAANWIKANRARFDEQNRRSTLKRVYGITPEQYDELLASQDGVCAICGGEDPDGRRLAVDHDHDTDIVRGLLCRPCNTAIGLFKDQAGLLIRAAQYLARSLN